jgi:Sulfotransferase family
MRSVDGQAFICGCGHSGTSLLTNMFAAHPEVFVPRIETRIFMTEDREEARRGYTAIVEEAVAANDRFIVEKTPKHIHRLDMIRDLVPGARFILPVRDGRDVVASLVKRHSTVDRAINRWIRDNRIVLAARDAPDVHVYRHEDLVRDVEGTLRGICEAIDLPFDPAMVTYHEEKRWWFGASKAYEPQDASVREANISNAVYRNWQINQPVFDSSGTWTQVVSEEALQPLLAGKGRPLMEAFGYLPDGARPVRSQGNASSEE